MLREKKQISENKYVMEITNSIDILEIRLGNLSEGTAEKMTLPQCCAVQGGRLTCWPHRGAGGGGAHAALGS